MMEMFKPPTDNLYKFMAVSGIVLIVAAVIVPPVFFQQTAMEYLVQLRGRDELKVHEEFTRERLDTLQIRELQATDEKNKLQKHLEALNSASKSPETEKLEGQIKEANRQIEAIADSVYELRLNLALKRAQVKHEETVSFNRRRDSRWFIAVGWIVGLLGIFVSYIGFRRWYKRLQKFQDRLVAKDAIAKLSTSAANDQAQPIDAVQVNVPEPTE